MNPLMKILAEPRSGSTATAWYIDQAFEVDVDQLGKHQTPLGPPGSRAVLVVKNPWAWIVSCARWMAEDFPLEKEDLLKSWRWMKHELRNWAAWNLRAIEQLEAGTHYHAVAHHEVLAQDPHVMLQSLGEQLGLESPRRVDPPDPTDRPDGRDYPFDPDYYRRHEYLREIPGDNRERLNEMWTSEYGKTVLERLNIHLHPPREVTL